MKKYLDEDKPESVIKDSATELNKIELMKRKTFMVVFYLTQLNKTKEQKIQGKKKFDELQKVLFENVKQDEMLYQRYRQIYGPGKCPDEIIFNQVENKYVDYYKLMEDMDREGDIYKNIKYRLSKFYNKAIDVLIGPPMGK
jgi:hypothetical protein